VIQDLSFLGRNEQGFQYGNMLLDTFQNGTVIPSGKYRYVTRVLKPFWKTEDHGAWEVYGSGNVEIKRRV